MHSRIAEGIFPLLLFIGVVQSQLQLQPDEAHCNVRDFGAVGDGSTMDTAAIQSAIDDCGSSNRPSVVYFPPGSYLSGTVFLQSNMVLLLDPGSVILSSPRKEDYPVGQSRWYVILGENVDDVTITGGGEINGQGLKFVQRFDSRKNVMVSWNSTGDCFGDECRPRLLGFINSRNIRVSSVSLKQPAYWCLHIFNSDTTRIHNVSIYGDFDTPNNDGIDIDGSNNTVITDCYIDTGDDAICIKTTEGPVYNLFVSGCWIRTKSCGIKLGSGSSYDFAGLVFENITIVDSHRGLGIQLRDSGHVHNVTFSNIVMSTRYYDLSWWGRAEPIYVTACPRNESIVPGTVHNVKFVNVTAVSENGIFLAATGGSRLENLVLENVNLELKRVTSDAGGIQDFRPGCQELVPHFTTSAIYMRNLEGASLVNVTVKGIKDVPLEFSPRSVTGLSFSTFYAL